MVVLIRAIRVIDRSVDNSLPRHALYHSNFLKLSCRGDKLDIQNEKIDPWSFPGSDLFSSPLNRVVAG